jgi:hypothetical protein
MRSLAQIEQTLTRSAEAQAVFKNRPHKAPKKDQPRCGAKTKNFGGRPCRIRLPPGWKRCKFHGGVPKTDQAKANISAGLKAYWAKWRATPPSDRRQAGPKTSEGRARIAEVQRQRWAKWRAEGCPPAMTPEGRARISASNRRRTGRAKAEGKDRGQTSDS